MPIGCQAYTQRRQHTRQQEIIRDTEQNSACASAELHAGMSMGRNEYGIARQKLGLPTVKLRLAAAAMKSEEHTSELQSLMRTSYAVYRLHKKKQESEQASQNHKTVA